MYIITVEDKFSSAHALRGYKGKCENLHGHNWKVFVSVKGNSLDDIGLVIDFHELKKYLKDVLNTIDHTNINETEFFSETNPSSENLARYIYESMEQKLNSYSKNTVYMESVKVYESEKSSCTYKV